MLQSALTGALITLVLALLALAYVSGAAWMRDNMAWWFSLVLLLTALAAEVWVRLEPGKQGRAA